MHDTETDPNGPTSCRSAGDRSGGDGAARRYRVGGDEPLDVAITYAIASIEEVDPTDVEPPLHDAVDPDALERLFESSTDDARARFRLGEYDVTIEDGGSEVLVVE